eukprot:8731454-Pyramimonas_sp.AAC.1
MQRTVAHTLMAVKDGAGGEDYDSFQMLGYDFMFDADMKVWLLEVRITSPRRQNDCCATEKNSTQRQLYMKQHKVMQIVAPGVEQVNGSPACAERMLEPFVRDLKETVLDSIFPCPAVQRHNNAADGTPSAENQFERIDLAMFGLE